jgi:nucleotide-binding universal stress UspA family protein
LIANKLMPVTGEEIEIENAAAEWPANLLVVCSWAEYREKAHLGPRSVGHVDQAACPVLLVRPPPENDFHRLHFCGASSKI